MAGAASPELTAAVSEAGALGGFGAAGATQDQLEEVLGQIRALTDRPFNVNLFTPIKGDAPSNPGGEAELRRALAPLHRELQVGNVPEPRKLFTGFGEKLDLLIEAGVRAVSIHFGAAESEHVAALEEAGITVLSTATSVDEARHLEAAGVDVVIAQGLEAGGHQGTFLDPTRGRLTTMTLLPAVVDAVDVPVVAAGGISNGRGVAAAFALGASGVQLGTAFLTCRENQIAAAYRRALLESSGADTTITTAISGRPARALRNRLVEILEPLDRLRYPEHYSLTRKLRGAASTQGRGDLLGMWAGMGVGELRSERSAADVLDELEQHAWETFERLRPSL